MASDSLSGCGKHSWGDMVHLVSKGSPPLPPPHPSPAPHPLFVLQKCAAVAGTPQTNYSSLHWDLWKNLGIGRDVFFIESEKFDPRNCDRQQSTKIAVEGKIFAFSFSKKSDLSLLSIECRVLDWCHAFERLVSVDAHFCFQLQKFLAHGVFCTGNGFIQGGCWGD